MRTLLAALAACSGMLTLVPAASAAIPLDLAEYADQTLRFDGQMYATGESPDGDSSGAAVAGACDVTGDGRDDLIAGAPTATIGTTEDAGRVLVVPGGDRLPGAYSLVAAAGGTPAGSIVVEGATTGAQRLGSVVACAGDVNGDGVGDVLVGTSASTPAALRGAYVVFGGSALVTAGTVSVESLAAHGFRIRGSRTPGVTVAGLGDLDGDGKDEVAIGNHQLNPGGVATGGVLVVAGRTATTDVDLDAEGSTLVRVHGAAASDQVAPVAGLGDVAGDGKPDYAVGAPQYDGPNGTNSGAAYVIDGAARGTVTLASWDSAGSGVLYPIWGASESFRAGGTVAGIGDADGDGTPDLAVGQHTGSELPGEGANRYRVVDVVFGKTTATAVDLLAPGTATWRIEGPEYVNANDHFGRSIAPLGDLDGDGRDDLAVGAPFVASGADDSVGGAFVVYGQARGAATLDAAALTCEQGARLLGEQRILGLGTAVSAGGDFVDGDSPSLLVGANVGTGGTGNGHHVRAIPLADVPGACGDEEPEPPTLVEVDWGFRENFRRYVTNGFDAANPATPVAASAGAFCDANPDVVRGGCDPKLKVLPTDPPPARALRWTPVGAGKADGSDTTVAAQGRVTFRFPGHFFTFKLEDPWFAIDGGQVTVRARVDLDVDPSFPAYESADVRVELGTFPLAGPPTVTAEHVQWKTGDGVLTDAAGQALGGFLGAGAVLDPVTITIPRSLGELPEEPTVPVVVDPPGGGGDTPKDPGGGTEPPVTEPTPARRPKWTIPAGRLKVTGGKPVAVATLACGSGTCRIGAPRTTILEIGRKRFKVRVLAPRRIAAGKRAKLRVQLTKAARKALAGKTGRTRFKVTVRENGRTTKKTIVARYKTG